MNLVKKTLLLTVLMVFAFSSVVFALNQEVYPIKGKHKGGDVTPKEAYKMLRKDPGNTFIVDIRTRTEYQDIGHPNIRI